MPEVLVSVVIPAYNAEEFVADAIAGVLAQTHRQVELIIVDDGSTDRTVAEARRFDDPRLQVVERPHLGVNHARNEGWSRASGEVISFLDADDYWFPTKLETQLPTLAAEPRVVAVGSLMRYQSAGGANLGISGQRVGEADQERIQAGRLVPFPLSSTLFRRSVVEKVGGLDGGLWAAEDMEFMARVARQGHFYCIEEVLGVYRIHRQSFSARRFSALRAQARFVRARMEARDGGGDLTWDEFERHYRPSARQRYDDLVHRWYRTAGLSVAERDWLRATLYGSLAVLFGPRYSLKRIRRQQHGRWGL